MIPENIPAELRALPQWVCAGPDKVPRDPRTGKKADPADPSTGATFNEACAAGMRHVGFILGPNDPFAVIDLDDPWRRKDKVTGEYSTIQPGDSDFELAQKKAANHQYIYDNFPTYAEFSQSGTGVHLVMRGSVPCGVRRDAVEVYSNQRYIIFTGNVLRAFPVTDCQEPLDVLFKSIGGLIGAKGELIEEDPLNDDAVIWDWATRAANADKFIGLCEGRPDLLATYPSQSEADHALMSMLAFYSRSNEQCRRMFRQTYLGQRDKAQRNDKYLNFTLQAIRSRQPKPVDVSKLLAVPEPPPVSDAPPPPPPPNAEAVALHELPAVGGSVCGRYSFPPGLVGEVAKYVLSSAIRPVPEIALVAAIGLCAGVCARSYNIKGSGLNQYLVLLAKTGRGKEGAASGIDNLVAEVRKRFPMVDQFIGPAAFASGQSLVKVLDRSPCFVSVLGEFGLTLQTICDPQRASSSEIMLKKVLLDIYAKSGRNKILRPSVYSDSDKNTKLVQAPNVTLLGESTPETFFNGLDSSHIAEGLISRFIIIEYKGNRPPPNENAFHAPSDSLVEKFGRFVNNAVTIAANHSCVPVSWTPDAKRILDEFGREADNRINNGSEGVEEEVWNRAQLKALKLAALIAVGVDFDQPTITPDLAQWAVELIRHEITDVMERFKSGDVGSGEAKQEAEVRRLFQHFQELSREQRESHRCPAALMDKQVCPAQYLTVYSRRLSCFKNDKRGPARALADLLSDMVRREVFEMVPLAQLREEFGMKSAIYYPGPGW